MLRNAFCNIHATTQHAFQIEPECAATRLLHKMDRFVFKTVVQILINSFFLFYLLIDKSLESE
jgi:hypothetical protein